MSMDMFHKMCVITNVEGIKEPTDRDSWCLVQDYTTPQAVCSSEFFVVLFGGGSLLFVLFSFLALFMFSLNVALIFSNNTKWEHHYSDNGMLSSHKHHWTLYPRVSSHLLPMTPPLPPTNFPGHLSPQHWTCTISLTVMALMISLMWLSGKDKGWKAPARINPAMLTACTKGVYMATFCFH